MTHLSDILSRLKIDITGDDEATNTKIFRRAETLMAMKVPERFWGCAFDVYDTDYNNDADVVSDLKELASTGGSALILCPISKRGKTTLAISMMGRSQYIHKYKPNECLFINLRREGERMWQLGTKREEIIKHWLGKKILLFDEMGREREEMKSIIESVIHIMFDEMKQVIITSFWTEKQWRDKKTGYCYSIIRRIEDSGRIFDLQGKKFNRS